MLDPGGYADMPYMAALPNGEIISTLTISRKEEGARDQTIAILKSRDKGESWGLPVFIEPFSGPEASWAMPFVDKGRLWLFYLYNARNIRRWPLTEGGARTRVDLLGDLAVRYSDDNGRTWSRRILIPVPRTAIDRRNGFKGRETILWTTGAPRKFGDYIYIGLSKGGRSYRRRILPETEAFLLRTKNPADPRSYELLPKGEHGFRAPDNSPVAEEPDFVRLPGGGIYVVFRTTAGKLAQAVSRDGGATWRIDWARHTDGTPLKHPRAKARLFRTSDGRYLLWFHNNAHRSWYHRNPAYISCGVLTKGDLRWRAPGPSFMTLT